MTELQKIAVAVREAAAWIDDRCGEPSEIGAELLQHADRLDALAAQEPVAWGQLGMLNGRTYLRENYERTPYPPPADVARNLNLVPLYAAPPAQSGEDARDAARYRFLRERDLDAISAGGVFAGMTPKNVVLNGDDLDAAIDRALLARREAKS